MRLKSLIASCLLMAIIGGCASAQPAKRKASSNEVIVSLLEAGGVIELKVGQILVVELPESPSSGRVWQMLRRPVGTVLMPDGNRYEQTDAQKARQDLIGMQYLRFEAVGPGETILSLALVRPGTGLSSSDERWMGQIIVR
jgi:predicted secreted protein